MPPSFPLSLSPATHLAIYPFSYLSSLPASFFHPLIQFSLLSSIHLSTHMWHLLSSYDTQSISLNQFRQCFTHSSCLINILKLLSVNNYCQKNIFRFVLLPLSRKVFIIQTYRLIQEMYWWSRMLYYTAYERERFNLLTDNTLLFHY